ncbi:hypothetical protein B0J12DRAFT_642216 [Macrophomina phaseolina]|uniref:Zinc finger C2H2-type protein n=1 Tax=Macrophomina phaseolina TaxID=35725 RepID=A0ABQ8GV63_9PEZI|nr:hypothetical protein B0J12DRAFT_642216 [Macrophomina phaseolina]
MDESVTAVDIESGFKSRKLSAGSSISTCEAAADCGCGNSCKCTGDEDPETLVSRKFACPYYSRNPAQPPVSISCAYPGFPTIFRVKEHLYRKHKASNNKCSRCHVIFDDADALQTHQRSEVVCQLRAPSPAPGFSQEQEKQLRSRKRSSRCQSEEEKWTEVYRILFPKDIEVPSAYIERRPRSTEEYADYQKFCRENLKQVLQRKLQSFALSPSNEYDQKVKGDLVDTIMDCQEKVFHLFRQKREPGAKLEVDRTTNEYKLNALGATPLLKREDGPTDGSNESVPLESTALHTTPKEPKEDEIFPSMQHISGTSGYDGEMLFPYKESEPQPADTADLENIFSTARKSNSESDIAHSQAVSSLGYMTPISALRWTSTLQLSGGLCTGCARNVRLFENSAQSLGGLSRTAWPEPYSCNKDFPDISDVQFVNGESFQ